MRIQTQKDRLDFADGTIEKKIYAYANLSYKKNLLVDNWFQKSWFLETVAFQYSDSDLGRRLGNQSNTSRGAMSPIL